MPDRHRSSQDARLDPRAPARLPGRLFAENSGPGGVEITTVNLSGGGALCESPIRCALGTTARVCLELSDVGGAPHPIVIGAIVVRVEGAGPFITALHFVNVPDRIRALIRQFVFDRLRDRSVDP